MTTISVPAFLTKTPSILSMPVPSRSRLTLCHLIHTSPASLSLLSRPLAGSKEYTTLNAVGDTFGVKVTVLPARKVDGWIPLLLETADDGSGDISWLIAAAECLEVFVRTKDVRVVREQTVSPPERTSARRKTEKKTTEENNVVTRPATEGKKVDEMKNVYNSVATTNSSEVSIPVNTKAYEVVATDTDSNYSADCEQADSTERIKSILTTVQDRRTRSLSTTKAVKFMPSLKLTIPDDEREDVIALREHGVKELECPNNAMEKESLIPVVDDAEKRCLKMKVQMLEQRLEILQMENDCAKTEKERLKEALAVFTNAILLAWFLCSQL